MHDNDILHIDTTNSRVGIGTTSPGSLLDIYQDAETWLRITGGATDINGIRLGTSSGSRQNVLYRSRSSDLVTLRAGIDDSDIQIIAGGSSNEIMRFDGANSRVGIGTTSPGTKLHINSGASDVVSIFESTDTYADIRLKDNDGSSHIRNSQGNLFLQADREDAVSNTTIRFHIDDSEKARITDSGIVLIGTTSTATPGFGNTNGQAFHVGDASHISHDQGTALIVNRGTNDGRDLVKISELRVVQLEELAVLMEI